MWPRGLVAGPNFESFQRRFFTPAEVAEHNQCEDLWVSYLGYVYNLTPLAELYKGNLLLKPIVEVAGQDISHWFDPKTKDIRKHIDPMTGCLKYRTPRGRFVHVPPQLPRSDWANDFGKPWWKRIDYRVGQLSPKTRNIRIINTLTSQEHTLEVGALESMWEILHRYLPYNAHAASYTWKYEGKPLIMEQTLEENGIQDEEEEFDLLNMDGTLHTPAILLYFNDDLTQL
ncbi:cytochrome b5 domain-containing protein 1 [Dipodomys spectabilis]|uniref:cytochrome b5 domain-containing protein 1 n=1 Tax=Dipodomys spectabilis TaxID=105255 RepID=UPI001C537771|nr:cytochrome b5 domain-containing protein 1 [Dipodomys spectabilis]XP_042526660.1 cytochrome b5 domain-containing protein 1 [Dipodomys spectabilis]